jgi:hypothetical protein
MVLLSALLQPSNSACPVPVERRSATLHLLRGAPAGLPHREEPLAHSPWLRRSRAGYSRFELDMQSVIQFVSFQGGSVTRVRALPLVLYIADA